MRLLIAPGLALQKLTTREPDDSMVECAIAALEPVLAADGIAVLGAVHVTPELSSQPPVVDQQLATGD